MSEQVFNAKWIKKKQWEYVIPAGRVGVIIPDRSGIKSGWIGVVQNKHGEFVKIETVKTVSEAKTTVEQVVRQSILESTIDQSLRKSIEEQVEIVEFLSSKHGKSKNTKKLLKLLKKKLGNLY